MNSQRYVPLGYQQLTTSLSAAVGLTVPAGANLVLLSTETQSVRWRDDGTAPTTNVGMLIPTGQAPFEYSGNLAGLLFIETTSSAVLNAAFYKAVG